MRYALQFWFGEYPAILDERSLDGETQHLIKRAVYQGDTGIHWFCSCSEFHRNLNKRANGTLSSIANEPELTCVHIKEIQGTK